MTVLTLPQPRAAQPEDGGLRSVSIAVCVLDCFDADIELGATQVARRLGIAKSTACRMLAALAVERQRHTPFTVVDLERLDAIAPSGPRAIAAVSVAGPTGQVLGPRKDFVVASVLRAARRISTTLAWDRDA